MRTYVPYKFVVFKIVIVIELASAIDNSEGRKKKKKKSQTRNGTDVTINGRSGDSLFVFGLKMQA